MLDLSTPALRQADILQAVPGLKEKSLQNWFQRKIIGYSAEVVLRHGVVDKFNPGRQAKRLANGYGLLVLATMYEMGRIGIDPTDAREIGFQVAFRADEMNKQGRLDRLETAIDEYGGFERWYLTPAKTIQGEGDEPDDLPGTLIGTQYRLVQKIDDGAVERFATGRVKIEIEADVLIKHYLAAALKTPAGPKIAPEIAG